MKKLIIPIILILIIALFYYIILPTFLVSSIDPVSKLNEVKFSSNVSTGLSVLQGLNYIKSERQYYPWEGSDTKVPRPATVSNLESAKISSELLNDPHVSAILGYNRSAPYADKYENIYVVLDYDSSLLVCIPQTSKAREAKFAASLKNDDGVEVKLVGNDFVCFKKIGK